MQTFFTSEHGGLLIKLARQTISQRLGGKEGVESILDLDEQLVDPAFKAKCGNFVTLKIDNQLRGCIGSLLASESVAEGVKRNALNAAFNDSRFSELTKKELPETVIEISLLSQPILLEYSGVNDLLGKIRPHEDGLIIKKGANSATFLPQVWRQLPDVGDFMTHLSIKAGLPGNVWRREQLEISTYQVQHFSE